MYPSDNGLFKTIGYMALFLVVHYSIGCHFRSDKFGCEPEDDTQKTSMYCTKKFTI